MTTKRKEDLIEHETWVNDGERKIVVRKLGEYGVETEEAVRGGETLKILPRDRRLNQVKTPNPKNDPFLNGWLVPVHLIESEEDYEKLTNNPNIITDEDMHELVRQDDAAFAEKANKINNPVVLMRMLEVAKAEDVPFSRVNDIQGRLQRNNPGSGDRVTQAANV